jgi:hypothetical protein
MRKPLDPSRYLSNILRKRLWCFVVLASPCLLQGQQLPREALSSFPADTQQIAYSNLADLRSSSEYPKIRERVLNRQLRYFQDFLRSIGIEPEKDVDEVILGWRGPGTDSAGFFGMAAGHFQSDRVRQYFARTQLPVRQYQGFDLYAFGSGHDPTDLFFTFLNNSLGAFGRLADLRALLDIRLGSVNALDSNSAFVNWEGEIEGLAPQWGILSGKAAANLAAGWFSASPQLNVDLKSFMTPVQAVLYRVQWENGFSANLAIVCKDTQSAGVISQLLSIFQSAPQPVAAGQGVSFPAILQTMEAHQNGSRVELNVSGPMEALDQVLKGNTAQ